MARLSRETQQKVMLERAVRSQRQFFTAEDLRRAVAKDGIGIATVYRYLKSLAKRGELHLYRCGKSMLYSAGKNSHCHFICTACKRQEHITVKDASFLKNKSVGDACHFQLDVYGLCKRCKSDKERKNT